VNMLRKWAEEYGETEVRPLPCCPLDSSEIVCVCFVRRFQPNFKQAWARVALATGAHSFSPFILSPVSSIRLAALPTNVSPVDPENPTVDTTR
jgi:hypothetical protein